MDAITKILKIFLKGLKWLLLLVLGVLIISALYNLTLKSSSEITEKLTESQKAYLAEYYHLQEEMMGNMWPSFSGNPIPAIVYNEEYAFLTGLENPSAGWVKMPSNEFRGGEWELVEKDHFYGEPYYRQYLPDPKITPENFTVKVGDTWVSTMQTKEFAEVSFYNGFKDELPPVVSQVFPYKIFWNLIMGEAESYIGGLIHEAFHGFQAEKVYGKFAEAESIAVISSEYPWDHIENGSGWHAESDFLIQAYQSESDTETLQFIKQFLEQRESRREYAELTGQCTEYEQKREWLEGLAKYTELKIGIMVSESDSYQPVSALQNQNDFYNYENRLTYLTRQISEVRRTAGRHGESRFYYSGMLQAMLLDRILPGWKSEIFEENVYLEDLLRKSVSDTIAKEGE